jgi:hypothetical protein
MTLMAVRNATYRDAEDLIAHYAPARYLCELMDSDTRLDHVTIFDFAKMLGPDGTAKINEIVLKTATEHGLVDPSMVMSDSTAQEAAIPYPNEINLMGRFMELARRHVSRLRGKFNALKTGVKKAADKVKGLVREARATCAKPRSSASSMSVSHRGVRRHGASGTAYESGSDASGPMSKARSVP